jgi:hypothetical protein
MSRTLFITSLLFVVMSLTACSGAASVAETIQCTVDFEATVYQGPSAGLSLAGPLALQVDATGNLTGALTTNDGTSIQLSGQAVGRSINLFLDLGNGKHIFGVGSLENNIQECKGAIGGPFTGPEPGDSGDWGYGIGG